jgi:hypothetical protein
VGIKWCDLTRNQASHMKPNHMYLIFPVKQSLLDLCRASLKGKKIFGERIGRGAEEQWVEGVEQEQELDGEAARAIK